MTARRNSKAPTRYRYLRGGHARGYTIKGGTSMPNRSKDSGRVVGNPNLIWLRVSTTFAPAISHEQITLNRFTSNLNPSGDLAGALPVGVFFGDLPVVS